MFTKSKMLVAAAALTVAGGPAPAPTRRTTRLRTSGSAT